MAPTTITVTGGGTYVAGSLRLESGVYETENTEIIEAAINSGLDWVVVTDEAGHQLLPAPAVTPDVNFIPDADELQAGPLTTADLPKAPADDTPPEPPAAALEPAPEPEQTATADVAPETPTSPFGEHQE